MRSTDEQRFEKELEGLFDPDRIHAKHGPFGEDRFLDELRAYYAVLSSDEKLGFERAVLRWLRSGEGLRRRQAIRLCGDLAIRGCVEELLRIAKALRGEPAEPDDVGWVTASLGEIGDRRALEFLRQEALRGDYPVGAVSSLAKIDLGHALGILPAVVEQFYRSGSPPQVAEALFSLLIDSRDPGRPWALGNALRQFPDKRYLLDRFRHGVSQLGFDAQDRPLTRGAKRKLLAEFRRGLEPAPQGEA